MTVGRSTGRSTERAILPFAAANGQNLFEAINTPHLSWFSTTILRAKIFIFLSILATSFKRVFGFKRSIFICF